ncbi:UNVERIFIED_CONTAM: TOM1-like protein 5 [Sesamum latifolium]|uniref:TOM1-like protein 5 n=1 Tax=Sesamum latifolium TaxID=2727402 RepID=A0AAW2XCM7_9LAMI
MTIVGTNFAQGGAVGGIINMASELVSAATSDKLTEMDWTKNIEICELVARDHRQAKDVVKAIKKRLGSKNPNTQLYAVLSDLPVREKIFLLLDAAQTSVGGATGRFPQYYSSYYELVGAKDEFTLDLVEQCSFQKQRVMHLAVTSRDEKVVSRSIELNEQLERVLRRHDALLAGRTMSTSNHINHEQEEEEEEEQLFRRIRKGKACVRPEDEDQQIERPWELMGRPVPGEMLHRPLIRPLTVERQREPIPPSNMEPKQEPIRPLTLELNQPANTAKPAVAIHHHLPNMSSERSSSRRTRQMPPL